jgi:hypothetical protein
MRHLRVVIYEVDDQNPNHSVEVQRMDMAPTPVDRDNPASTLEQVETAVWHQGNTLLRNLFKAQWKQVDTKLVEDERQRFSP